MNICVITAPLKSPQAAAMQIGISQFCATLAPIAKEVFVITGNLQTPIPHSNVNAVNIKVPIHELEEGSYFRKVIRVILTQFIYSKELIKLSMRVDIVILFFGNLLLVPSFVAKLLGKKIMVITTGSVSKSQRNSNSFPWNYIISKMVLTMEHLIYMMADRIISFGEDLSEWDLQKYKCKVTVARRHFVDIEKFGVRNGIYSRGIIIGYVGRLSKEKGIMNMLEAIPQILEKQGDIEFLIAGDGPLKAAVIEYINCKGLGKKIHLLNWLQHDYLPEYLNQMRLLVIPSYTEGFPKVAVEAMACGTPILAAPVGGLPDVITHEKTGFLLKSNSPLCIATGIAEVLAFKDLHIIVNAARALVENEYTYEAAVERYRVIMASLL